MKKTIIIPVIAGLAIVIGVILVVVLTSGEGSYYTIKLMDHKGNVKIDRDGKSLEAQQDMKLRDKDYVTVPSDGFLRINCDKSIYAYFEHNTEASINAGRDKKLKIKLVKGEMVVEIQRKLADDESFNVVTPNTTLAIRGTVIAVKTNTTSDGVVETVNYCLEGKAEVEINGSETKTLSAGEGWLTVTDASGSLMESRPIGAEDFEFADIEVDSLKGADDNPIILNYLDNSGPLSAVEINGENFPDMMFRLYIMDQIDTNGDGVLSGDELKTESINVDSSGVKDLKGIEYFTSLKVLGCSGNELTTLDLKNNTKLTNLFCGQNSLTGLDISNCKDLNILSCARNELTELDVSNCRNLAQLSCDRNKLQSLNVKGLSQLQTLLCNENELKALDVSDCVQLIHLDCYRNMINKLDVSHNTVLKDLYCHQNSISAIDLSKNPELEHLAIGDNKLTSIDVSHNPELVELGIYTNEISEIDVTNNPKLKELTADSNKLTWLNVSQNPELEKLSCGFNELTNLDISHNPKLKSLTCFYNELYKLDASNNPELTDIVYDNGKCEIIR